MSFIKMSSGISKKQICSDLIGIGIFMSGERTSFKDHPITPEAAIVNAVSIAKSDRLILQLMHTWIMNYSEIIHVEALKHLIKDAEPVGRAILASLLSHTGDRKFEAALKRAKVPENESNHGLHKMMDFAAKIGQVPYDKHFKKFGLSVSALVMESEKKMIHFEHIVEINPFIKYRYVFGANWRADIAALMTLSEYTPTEVTKLLGCSCETARRYMKGPELIG
ncbi:hypothetical protein BDW_06270 [Bdellovibrio bacteriovorus W]|nr:hypothetical protein BDW_06270 [Bdellovibrio bacteriovorus W]